VEQDQLGERAARPAAGAGEGIRRGQRVPRGRERVVERRAPSPAPGAASPAGSPRPAGHPRRSGPGWSSPRLVLHLAANTPGVRGQRPRDGASRFTSGWSVSGTAFVTAWAQRITPLTGSKA
jgi:hypothetical protein